jgi:hypothetical protein
MIEHLSNYEYQCTRCGQLIKPRTPYYIYTRFTEHKGQTDTKFDRVHVECPKVKDE